MRLAFALGLTLAACGPSSAPAPRAAPRSREPANASSIGLARYAMVDRLGVTFDEAGHASSDPRPEPAIVDGVRVVVDAGYLVGSAPHADRLAGFRSMPDRLGGGFVLWSDDRVYRASSFLGELSPIADLGATGGARPWLTSILLRTPSGLFEVDPRSLVLHRAAMPGVADALALDTRRAVRVNALGRASLTVDGGASWTDLLATRGMLVRSLVESSDGIVIDTDTSSRFVLGPAGAIHPLSDSAPRPADLTKPFAAEPLLTDVRPTSSRVLPPDVLAHAVAYGALLPGGRMLVAREHGLRVLAVETGLPIADADLTGVDPQFSRCQAASAGTLIVCMGDAGAAVIDLDASFARPSLEATFPSGGGFFGGPRARLAFDGRCGPDPPSSLDLGPGTPSGSDADEDTQSASPPPSRLPAASTRSPAEAPPEDEDAYVCLRAAPSRWVERRLRGDDAHHLYRWVPGDDGSITALVLAGPAEEGDAGPATPGSMQRATPEQGVRVIRVDPDDPALGGAAFPALLVPDSEAPHRSIDTDFWQDDDGAIRGWIRLPTDSGDDATEAHSSAAEGSSKRAVRTASGRGGRTAGVRIDASGHVTVFALPNDIVEVVTGGRFGLAMSGGAEKREWFETTDGGITWTPVEGPPVGAIEAPSDEHGTFACSEIGCAWSSGVIRIGWGGPRPKPSPPLALTAAVSPRVRDPEPLALSCRLDADPPWSSRRTPERPPSKPAPRPKPKRPPPSALAPPKHAPPSAPASRTARPIHREPTVVETSGSDAPIALRFTSTTIGLLRDHAWTGDVLPPFQPAASLRHVSGTDRTLRSAAGAVAPILGAGARSPIDLLLFVDKRRLRAGGGAASFLSFDVSGRIAVAADAPDGTLVALDAERLAIWIARGDAVAAAVRLARVADVTRARLTLARRLSDGRLTVALYSTSTGELLAGDLDLGRAEVGPLEPLGKLDAFTPSASCSGATHRLLVELPARLSIAGRAGEDLLNQQVTVSAVLLAGGPRTCVEAIEAALPKGSSTELRATFSPDAASVWSAGATARASCSIRAR